MSEMDSESFNGNIDEITEEEFIHEINKVKVLNVTDLSNDTFMALFGEIAKEPNGRLLYRLLTDGPIYLNALAKKADRRVPLVVFYMKKFKALGILNETLKPISKKKTERRHYDITQIIIFSPGPFSLKNLIKSGAKFVGIIFAGIFSYSLSNIHSNKWGASSLESITTEPLFPVVVGLSVIVCGLIIERLWLLKNKKR